MATCLAACDVVVSRAGAITLSEIQAQGKPAVLIPSPNVAENHQYHNAMAMVNKKAAEIIEEKDLTPELLIEKVDKLLESSAGLIIASLMAEGESTINDAYHIFRGYSNIVEKLQKLGAEVEKI